MKVGKSSIDQLLEALLDGDQTGAVAETRKLLGDGVGHEQIVTEGVEAAMTQLEAKCTVEQFNLLEIMLVGRAAMEVMKDLYPRDASPPYTKGTVVVGALEGDVHDLGKNIVKMVLTAKGYRVVDCGKDCPVEKLIDTAEQEAAVAIGVSGLITTVIPLVRQLRDILAERRLGHIKVVAGGAALKQGTTESLNVDFVAETAFDGTRYLDQITKSGK
jgi:methylmalonyl-CoA mutase cobalamin-binding domain/chain